MKVDQKAVQFQQLHCADELFIMANAWNAGSAVLLEEAGIKAIGTTRWLVSLIVRQYPTMKVRYHLIVH